MNLRESTQDFQLLHVTQEMMGLPNELGVTSEIKQRQGLTFWII